MRGHAGSLRTRVTLAVIAVLAVVLLAVGLTVNAVFAAQSERSLDALLTGRAQLARQLGKAGRGPQQIVNQVSTDAVVATLRTRSGQVFTAGGQAGPQARTVTTKLTGGPRVNGARLTIAVDTTLVDAAQQRLRRLLILFGSAALLISAVLVTVIVRRTLRPLDEVAGLARRITAGQRGQRLRPDRTDTEIGQTAQALDDMLDELEGAEARARAAEGRSRQFLADAAHELRTPVAGVQAAAETLLHDGATLEPETRQRLEALLIREAGRTGRLVSDLLVMARLDAGEVVRPRVPTDLNQLASQEVQRVRLTHPSLTLTQTGPGAVVAADEEQIGGIIRNLLDNAARAAAPNGQVGVTVGSTEGWAVVDVEDNGPGVAAADRERIFERLVRLDPERTDSSGGSGLGLAIARGYARAHGGDVRCLPSEQGGLFRLALPQA
ncbi:MAG: HAMP domain-containing histidine kinase [Microlunatus sp.]|nr:HAMP domain-containing histidine kinase [Microlunatus sp.]MDN5771172.1 HAMP domain-containing histidine kinase [Microlunatus sp.]